MTIRVLGDSSTRRFKSQPESWLEQLSASLDQKLVVVGKEIGDINETYKSYYEMADSIKPNDILILTLSSNSLEVDREPLLKFLVDVDHKTFMLGLKTIIFFIFDNVRQQVVDQLPLFTHIHFPHGLITDVAMNEWKKDFIEKNGREWLITSDVRVNHLTKSNHYVLTEKILNYLEHGQQIDFTHGFYTEILDNEVMSNLEFIKKELFDGIMIKALLKRQKQQRKQQ